MQSIIFFVVVFNGIFSVSQTVAEHHFAELRIVVMNQLQADKKWLFVEKLVQVRGSNGSWLSAEAAQHFPSEFPTHGPKIETLFLNS